MENETLSRIENLIKQNALTANKVAVACKLQSNAFTHWKNGTAKPSVDALIKLADYFQVSVDYLLGRTEQNIANNATTSPLLARISKLDKSQQAKVMAYIDGLQGADASIADAFKSGQEIEKQRHAREATMTQQKKFN